MGNMRTEYTLVHTDTRGKKHYSVYPKDIAFETFNSLKEYYELREQKLELFRVRYNGTSYYDSVKM